MFRTFLSYTFLLLALLAGTSVMGQTYYQFNLHRTPEVCTKGAVAIEITGTETNDSIFINWSTGRNDVRHLSDLEAGDYAVIVHIVHYDTIRVVKDTVIHFSILKEQCPLIVAKYFSPNDDGYNDRFTIGNIENYPNFEFNVYNKWGQRIHQQKSSYVPWDGKWLGTDLPDGTYYFVLFYDKLNKNEFVKGDITILR